MTSASEAKTVLHIFSGDLWAGAEVMIFNLLNKLKDYPELRIIALSLNKGVLTDKLQNAGIQTYIIPEAIYSFPKIFSKAFSLLKRKNIDLIHSHRYKENLLVLLLAKSMRVRRLITTMHGLSNPPIVIENGSTPVRLKTRMDYFILNHCFSQVVAVSQEMKNTLVEKYHFRQKKVDVIYNGIPIPSTNQAINQSTNDCFHIGTVGRMVPVKNFNLFLEIASELRKQMDKVHFSILGDGPLKKDLIERTKGLKIDDCVEFLSPRLDPFPYYRSLDLYLNTSLHEGIPLSILEAMACGNPVVAPKVGGIPEIISHAENGILVNAYESKEFVKSCLEIIEDKELRMTLGENARKRIASSFSSLTMAESYKRIYQQL